ncbi:MAG: hypothetical protein CGW95_03575 [Phenylobacterium zucineum]|nr:MAG: hypothetical protein CGW95_03575 [Phenylobacterium zucineum]
MSEVVHLASRAEFGLRRARNRVETMSSLFQALKTGGLLDVGPKDPKSQAKYVVGLKLLDLMQAELDLLRRELP